MEPEVKVIRVIVTNIERRGNGKEHPVRIITQYWDMSGKLIIERDPCAKVIAPEDGDEYFETQRLTRRDNEK